MVEKEYKHKIIRKSFGSLVFTLVNRFGALVFTLLIARFLAPEGYGLYSLALSIATVVYTFSDLGMNYALARYVSYAIKKNKSAYPYYKYIFNIKITLTLIFSAVLLILAYPISYYLYHQDSLFFPLIVCAFYTAISSFESFYTMIIYSLEKVNIVSMKEFAIQTLRIALLLAIFFIIKPSNDVLFIFLALLLVYVIILLFDILIIRRFLPSIFQKTKESINKERIQRFVTYFTIIAISTVIFSNLDALILGVFVGTAYIGYYRVAISLIAGVASLYTFPNLLMVPLLTKANKAQVKFIMERMFDYTMIITIPSIFGIILLSDPILRIFFGTVYLPADISLRILALVILPSTFIPFIVSFFSAEEEVKIFAKLIIYSTIVNFILTLSLVWILSSTSQAYATMGAAIGVTISWIFYLAYSMRYLKSKFDIHLKLKVLLKPLIASVIMAAVLEFCILEIGFISKTYFAILIIIGAVVYCAVIYLIGGVSVSHLKYIRNALMNKIEQ